MKKIVLIDFSFICFRNYHTLKDLSFKGIGTGMAFGAIKNLYYLFKKYKWKPHDVVLVGDGKARHKFKLFPEYKKDRKKDDAPEKMSVPFQLKLTRLLVHYLGLTYARDPDNEADDTIATLVRKNHKDCEVIVVGNDHDLYQCLAHENTSLLLMHSQGEEMFDENKLAISSEILATDYWKVQTLAGCTTDKVPGCPGIGEPTAQKMVNMNSFEKIIHNDPDLKFPDARSKTMFRKNYDKWNYKRDYKLVKLNDKLDIKDIIFGKQNKEKTREWFIKLGFKHFLNPSNYNKILETFA